MTVRFTSTNAVVAGISKIEIVDEAHWIDDGEDEDDSDGEREDDDSEIMAIGHTVLVFDELTSAPRTAKGLATKLDLEAHEVSRALAKLQATGQVAKVAPAREDGETRSLYMRTGTEAFDAFVAAEKLRVDAQVEKWAPKMLKHAPKFYEDGADRMAILEALCEDLDHELAEEIRTECRNVFYGMAERNLLFHQGHGWKAFRTEADEKNLEMLRGAVREVEGYESMTPNEVAEKLPGFVDIGLLRHAMRG